MEPDGETFHLIFVKQGNGIIQINDRQRVFIAPTVFCLNSRDAAILKQTQDLYVQVLCFASHTINEALETEDVYDARRLSQIALMDRDTTGDKSLLSRLPLNVF